VPKIDAALRRDAKRLKEARGMQVDGRTTKTTLARIVEKKAADARKRLLEQQEILDEVIIIDDKGDDVVEDEDDPDGLDIFDNPDEYMFSYHGDCCG
jgi:hypothetical protein